MGGVSRQKKLIAEASIDILKLMVRFGEGVMAQQHIQEYMSNLTGRSFSQVRREIADLEEYDLIKKMKVQRLVFWSVSKYAKGLVLGLPARNTNYSGETKHSLIRSLTFNEFLLKYQSVGWEKHTVDSLYEAVSNKTSLFYRTREGFRVLERYQEQKIIESHPIFDQELAYLADKLAKSTKKPFQDIERQSILKKLPTFHGLQQMNFHPYGVRRINGLRHVQVLFFEFDRNYDGREFTDRMKKVSDYLRFIIKQPGGESRFVYRVFARNERRKEYLEKHFEPFKEQYRQNQILVQFEVLDIDERFFSGERVLL